MSAFREWIVTALNLGGERERQIALVAVDSPGKVERRVMMFILIHLQANIAYGHLFAIFMLEKRTLSTTCSCRTS